MAKIFDIGFYNYKCACISPNSDICTSIYIADSAA